jgi:pimeloyl-ACP methyl ester carboxylesterase
LSGSARRHCFPSPAINPVVELQLTAITNPNRRSHHHQIQESLSESRKLPTRFAEDPYKEPDHLWLSVFFMPSSASQAAGREFLKRFRLRTKDRDPEVNDKVAPAQRAAIAKWGAPRERPYDYLKAIQQPTLVVNGSTDPIIYTVNSFILQQNLPNAQLIIYPDSAHGSHHQYPELFVRHVSMFLSEQDRAAWT